MERTARFIWDESSDLVRMHQIYIDRNLTLIGPISEDGNKVFSSLTYYLLLPFTVMGGFHPVSPVYGTAFWGTFTVILLLILVRRLTENKIIFYLTAVLLVVWHPLIETSRWAWNPNLIPFWTAFGLLMFYEILPTLRYASGGVSLLSASQRITSASSIHPHPNRRGILEISDKNKNWSLFLSGLFFGFTVHHHYISIFSLIGFWLIVLIKYLREKHYLKIVYFTLGVGLALSPFIIFDLTHPPGLFLSRLLYFNYIGAASPGISNFILKLILTLDSTFNYLIPLALIKYIFYVIFGVLFIKDIKNKSFPLVFIFVFFIQIVGVTLIENFYPHYIIPGIIFFLVYIVYQRPKNIIIYQKILLLLLITASLFTLRTLLTKVTWENDIRSINKITDITEDQIKQYDLKNNNIASIASPDPNTYGRRYRDLLHLKGVSLKTKDEYYISDHLFVISTSSEEVIRNDKAYEMSFFNKGKLVQMWEIENSEWVVYLFERN